MKKHINLSLVVLFNVLTPFITYSMEDIESRRFDPFRDPKPNHELRAHEDYQLRHSQEEVGERLRSQRHHDFTDSDNLTSAQEKAADAFSPTKDPKKLTSDEVKALTPEQISKLTPEQIKALTPDQINELRAEQIKALTPEQIQELTPNQIKGLSWSHIEGDLSFSQITAITENQFLALSDSQNESFQRYLSDLSLEELHSLTIKSSSKSLRQMAGREYNKILDVKNLTVSDLTPEKIKSLTTAQAKAIKFDVISKFSLEQMIAFADKYKNPTDNEKFAIEYNLKKMTQKNLKELIRKTTTGRLHLEAVKELNSRQSFSSDDIKELTADDIQKLTFSEVESLTPDNIKQLTSEQIQALMPDKINELTPDQIKALSPDQIKALTPDQLQALTPEQIKELSSEQIQAFNPDQLEVLSPEQITELTSGQPVVTSTQPEVTSSQSKTLTPDEISNLTEQEIVSLPADVIENFSLEQMIAFGNKYPYIPQMNPEQETALVEKLRNMSSKDLDELMEKTEQHTGYIYQYAMAETWNR